MRQFRQSCIHVSINSNMNFQCQTGAIERLKLLAEHKQHGILIVGIPGSGKTYLARQYANFLGIENFYIINPVVADLKATIDLCLNSDTPVVLCIENLDSGVVQASYPLLKFIEDCPNYVYVVVTCCNLDAVPDTIPSRCALVEVSQPTRSDISQYASSKDAEAYERLHETKIWSCIRGFKDVDTVLSFKIDQIKYFDNLPVLVQSNEPVSSISWKLTHFEDNSELDAELSVRYLLNVLSGHKRRACIDCLNDLAENRMSKNAIVSKLIFEIKYT